MWDVKELVRDFEYMNNVRCWYNVGAEHEQVISLNIDADIVDFLNIVKMYKFKVLHLYVEHMVDRAIVVNEPLFLQSCQTQVGEGSGRVDEVHTVSHEDGNGVNANEQFQNYHATMSKSPRVQVKTKAAHKITP